MIVPAKKLLECSCGQTKPHPWHNIRWGFRWPYPHQDLNPWWFESEDANILQMPHTHYWWHLHPHHRPHPIPTAPSSPWRMTHPHTPSPPSVSDDPPLINYLTHVQASQGPGEVNTFSQPPYVPLDQRLNGKPNRWATVSVESPRDRFVP